MNSALHTETARVENLRAELSEALASLASERAARRRLECSILEELDGEHERLAELLHDGVCQSLTAVRLYARIAKNQVQEGKPEAPSALRELESMVQRCLDELHELTSWVYPPKLDERGLAPALAELAAAASRRVPCALSGDDRVVGADAYVQAQLLRVAHRALQHLVQHGSTATTDIRLSSDEECITLRISAQCDTAPQDAWGALLEQRLRTVRGSLSISRELGRVTITCRAPKRC